MGTKKLVTILQTRAKDRTDDWSNRETEVLIIVVGLRRSNGIWTKAWRKLDRMLSGWLGAEALRQLTWLLRCRTVAGEWWERKTGCRKAKLEKERSVVPPHAVVPPRGQKGLSFPTEPVHRLAYTAEGWPDNSLWDEGKRTLEQNLGCGELGAWCVLWLSGSL